MLLVFFRVRMFRIDCCVLELRIKRLWIVNFRVVKVVNLRFVRFIKIVSVRRGYRMVVVEDREEVFL